MNRQATFAAILLFACISIGSGEVHPRAAAAACRVKTQTAVNTVIVTPVPLAVSVGVPVAEVAPYYYSYSAYNPAPLQPPQVDVDALATKLAEKLAAAGSTGGGGNTPGPAPQNPNQPSKVAARSLIAQKCAQCHSGPEPKGKLSLENPTALDCPTRLKAIRAILSEKMPQGGPRLTPDEAGKLLEEFVGQ
jgi:hypothetical protein